MSIFCFISSTFDTRLWGSRSLLAIFFPTANQGLRSTPRFPTWALLNLCKVFQGTLPPPAPAKPPSPWASLRIQHLLSSSFTLLLYSLHSRIFSQVKILREALPELSSPLLACTTLIYSVSCGLVMICSETSVADIVLWGRFYFHPHGEGWI